MSGELDRIELEELLAADHPRMPSKGSLAQDGVRAKSASVCRELMFTRPRFKTADMIEQHGRLTQVAELIDAGRIRGALRETLRPINATNLRAAHAKLDSG